jgi:hypothetical protein
MDYTANDALAMAPVTRPAAHAGKPLRETVDRVHSLRDAK